MKFARIAPKSVETADFCKISKSGNYVRFWYFTQCKSGFNEFSDNLCGRFSGRFVYKAPEFLRVFYLGYQCRNFEFVAKYRF